MSADVMGSMPCVIAALVTLYARDRGISEQVPRRKLSWGSLGCPGCGRKRRRP